MTLSSTLLVAAAANHTAAGNNTSVVLSNLAYLIGAVVLAALLVTIVVIRHHRPRSTQQDMDTFHRGLAALAPDRHHRAARGRYIRAEVPADPRPGPRAVPVGADGSAPRRPSSRSKSG